jgi:hypothetical protein
VILAGLAGIGRSSETYRLEPPVRRCLRLR